MPPPAAPPVPTLPADAFTSGLAFHRLVFARRRTGWWTPLAVGGLGVAFFFAFTIVLMIPVFVLAIGDESFLDRLVAFTTEPSFDLTDPAFTALLLGSIIIMMPAYLLASRIINGPRLGLASSAAGRLRWGWMLLCGAVAVGITAVVTGLMMLIPVDAGPLPGPAENPQWVWTLLVLLLLVPLQAAAEEYVFRGYLMQAIGRWLRHPAFAILLPVPLFVLGHLYDVVGQVAVGLFAVAAGWLTWRTGGLEAAIALHVVNNLSAFLLGLAGAADVNETSVGWLSLATSVLMIGGFVAAVEVLLRRRGLPRTLVLTRPAPPAVVAGFAGLAPAAPVAPPAGLASTAPVADPAPPAP